MPGSLYSQQLACGRNVVDVADGFDIPENQQYPCHFYPTLLPPISSSSALGFFSKPVYSDDFS